MNHYALCSKDLLGQCRKNIIYQLIVHPKKINEENGKTIINTLLKIVD
jgi:hypothetical protein